MGGDKVGPKQALLVRGALAHDQWHGNAGRQRGRHTAGAPEDAVVRAGERTLRGDGGGAGVRRKKASLDHCELCTSVEHKTARLTLEEAVEEPSDALEGRRVLRVGLVYVEWGDLAGSRRRAQRLG